MFIIVTKRGRVGHRGFSVCSSLRLRLRLDKYHVVHYCIIWNETACLLSRRRHSFANRYPSLKPEITPQTVFHLISLFTLREEKTFPLSPPLPSVESLPNEAFNHIDIIPQHQRDNYYPSHCHSEPRRHEIGTNTGITLRPHYTEPKDRVCSSKLYTNNNSNTMHELSQCQAASANGRFTACQFDSVQ